jgi:hypothetical protein
LTSDVIGSTFASDVSSISVTGITSWVEF